MTLRVTDDDGAATANTVAVTVTAPPPPSNALPVAAFTYSCTDLTCRFVDRSTDSDGTIATRRWTFGNGSTGTATNPTRTYAAAGTYTVTLRVSDDDGAWSATTSQSVTVGLANRAPNAAFTQSCIGLTCRFTDRSTDPDGGTLTWRWTFGDGSSSTTSSPSRTYAASGTYTVTLRVTDNAGAVNQESASFRVITSTRIPLTVTGRVDATKQYMTLIWSGARGTTVDVYRNGILLRQEANDGQFINSRLLPGANKYTYRVCELGTTVCSNDATVVF